MTRRHLMLATPAALLAQSRQTPPQRAPDSRPQSPKEELPNEELNIARDLLRRNAEQLAKVAVPMATEPACHFKA